MTIDEKKLILIASRLEQAKESLDEAAYLLEGNKSLRSIANRVYYGMFYAVLALLVNEPYSTSKHSGVISYFNRRFIKEGVFSQDLGLAINRAFEIRQRGDYKEQIILDREQVTQTLEQAKIFVDAVEKFVHKGSCESSHSSENGNP